MAYLFYDWRKSKGDEWAKKLEKGLKGLFREKTAFEITSAKNKRI